MKAMLALAAAVLACPPDDIHPPFGRAKGEVYFRCEDPRAIDGDTIKCASGYSLRLVGVQAPEMHKRAGIENIAGDAVASRDWLSMGIAQGPLTVRYFRRDKYGRPVVMAVAGAVNLSCWQLAGGGAQYRPAMDERGIIAATCGLKPQT